MGLLLTAACGSVTVVEDPSSGSGTGTGIGSGSGSGGSGGGIGPGAAPPTYPSGPYGTEEGDVIADYPFEGYPRPAEGIGADFRRSIALAQFYNPTGSGSYPAGSPFGAGEPQPVALVLRLDAVWAGPSKAEAANIFVPYESLREVGGEVLGLLAESDTPGDLAQFSELDNWIPAFGSTHPSVIEPAGELVAAIGSDYPTTLLIDTRTMTIQRVVGGLLSDGFWQEAEALAVE